MKNFSPAVLGHLAIVITMAAWGTSFISTKIAVQEIPPFTLAFIRFFITSILLLMIIRKAEPQTTMTTRNAAKIAVAGFIGICVYFCFENIGIQLTTATNASLIISITPLLSIALNMIVFKARLSLLEWSGVIVGIIGAYLTVTANGSIDFSSDNFRGNVYMIGAIIAWAVYTILSKQLQSLYSGLYMVTWQTVFATVSLIPFALWEYREWQTFSLTAFAHILYLATICSGVGYFLYTYALKKLDVVLTTLYLNLIPVIGVISGYLVLDETILPIQLVGGVVIIVAICIANIGNLLNLRRNH